MYETVKSGLNPTALTHLYVNKINLITAKMGVILDT